MGDARVIKLVALSPQYRYMIFKVKGVMSKGSIHNHKGNDLKVVEMMNELTASQVSEVT
jgi:hypothetical protein